MTREDLTPTGIYQVTQRSSTDPFYLGDRCTLADDDGSTCPMFNFNHPENPLIDDDGFWFASVYQLDRIA